MLTFKSREDFSGAEEKLRVVGDIAPSESTLNAPPSANSDPEVEMRVRFAVMGDFELLKRTLVGDSSLELIRVTLAFIGPISVERTSEPLTMKSPPIGPNPDETTPVSAAIPYQTRRQKDAVRMEGIAYLDEDRHEL